MKPALAQLLGPKLIKQHHQGRLAAWQGEVIICFCASNCVSPQNPNVPQGPLPCKANAQRSVHFPTWTAEMESSWQLTWHFLSCLFDTICSAEGTGTVWSWLLETTLFQSLKSISLVPVADLSSNLGSFKKQLSMATKHFFGGGNKKVFKTAVVLKRKR